MTQGTNDNDTLKSGEELNQMSRLLFGEAANKWYGAMVLQIGAGIIAAEVGVFDVPEWLSLVGAITGTILIVAAYGLQMWCEQQYRTAETMRRQSVLTEALGWRVTKTQLSRWRQQSGIHIVGKLKTDPREPDYYASQKPVGPGRLAEMTIESAFYTRHLYAKLSHLTWIVFAAATGAAILIVGLALVRVIPDSVELVVAKALLALIPTALAVNLFGWGLKLGWMVIEICSIEEGLENLLETKSAEDTQVLRLVSEYNCVVICGVPIHDWLFKQWHNEITEMWDER